MCIYIYIYMYIYVWNYTIKITKRFINASMSSRVRQTCLRARRHGSGAGGREGQGSAGQRGGEVEFGDRGTAVLCRVAKKVGGETHKHLKVF